MREPDLAKRLGYWRTAAEECWRLLVRLAGDEKKLLATKARKALVTAWAMEQDVVHHGPEENFYSVETIVLAVPLEIDIEKSYVTLYRANDQSLHYVWHLQDGSSRGDYVYRRLPEYRK